MLIDEIATEKYERDATILWDQEKHLDSIIVIKVSISW